MAGKRDSNVVGTLSVTHSVSTVLQQLTVPESVHLPRISNLNVHYLVHNSLQNTNRTRVQYIKIDVQETGWEGMDRIDLAQDKN